MRHPQQATLIDGSIPVSDRLETSSGDVYLESRSPLNQCTVQKCRFIRPQTVLDAMRSYPSGFLLFIVKSLTTFLSLSLMYQLLTALLPVPLFVTCSFYDPCPETRQIAMVHQTLHSQLFVPTLSGALRGALLSIPFTVLITRLPERPQHLQLRWLLLGMLIGGGIGAFLRSFPIRWELWLLTRPHLCWNLGPYVLLDTSYFLNLITIFLLALFFSLSHKSRNASPEDYRFGCRN